MVSRGRTPFGQRMREARERAGLTQMEVRKRLHVSQGTLSGLETGAHSTRRLVDFAQLYGVSPEWLAKGEGEATEQTQAPPAREGLTLQALARALSGSSDATRRAVSALLSGLTDAPHEAEKIIAQIELLLGAPASAAPAAPAPSTAIEFGVGRPRHAQQHSRKKQQGET